MKAFITGITGQDGSYMAELLLAKGYEVYGLVRRSSVEKLDRIAHLLDRVRGMRRKLFYKHCPMRDLSIDVVRRRAGLGSLGQERFVAIAN